MCSLKRKVKTFMMTDLRQLYSSLALLHQYPLKDAFDYDISRVRGSIVDSKVSQFQV